MNKMDKVIVRFKTLELEHFKNIENSKLTIEKENSSESIKNVLGIYGQNGSGKTAVIDAFEVYKAIVSSQTNSKNFHYYINNQSKEAKLTFTLDYQRLDVFCHVIYEITLSKGTNEEDCILSKEKISFKTLNQENTEIRIKYHNGKFSDDSFQIFFQDKNETQNMMNRDDLLISYVSCVKDNQSMLFNQSFFENVSKKWLNSHFNFCEILKGLIFHSIFYMYIINVKESSLISSVDQLVWKYNLNTSFEKKHIESGSILIYLLKKNEIKMEQLESIRCLVNQTNMVMSAIVPDFKIEIKTFNEHLLKDGSLGIDFQLVSVLQDGSCIPLYNESEGIKKILSICSALTVFYNKEQAFVAIDEIDSGVFEYLLGEMVKVLSDGGKGQLLFTSHNLRLLEILPKSNVLFSTSNPNKRFIPLRNVKTNNNVRDFYLRSIMYGGQKEEMYRGVDSFKLEHAFYQAGKVFDEEGKIES